MHTCVTPTCTYSHPLTLKDETDSGPKELTILLERRPRRSHRGSRRLTEASSGQLGALPWRKEGHFLGEAGSVLPCGRLS